MQALWPDKQDATAQAEAIPYASILVRAGDIRGLMVMGASSGALSYWPSAEGLLLEFEDDSLHAASGLGQELLSSHYQSHANQGETARSTRPWRQSSPTEFTVVRHWFDERGLMTSGTAVGQLSCGEVATRELPLGSRALQYCEKTLAWPRGETTRTQLWRDPDTLALWEVDGQFWPDGPRIAWQVARHWW